MEPEPPDPLDAAAQRELVEAAAARRERRYIIAIAVVAGVAVPAGVLVGVLTSGARPDRSWWWWTLLIGVPTLCAGLLLVGTFAAVRWRRRRGSGMFALSPLYELPTMRQRSALVKAIRRGDPLPPEQHDLAVRVARDFTRRTWLLWLYPGIAVISALNAVIQDGWLQILNGTLTVLWLGITGYFAWLIRRMRARLRELEPGQ